MGMLGGQEILILLVVVAVLFGTSRLPKIGKALGEGIREFRNVGRELTRGIDDIDEGNKGNKGKK